MLKITQSEKTRPLLSGLNNYYLEIQGRDIGCDFVVAYECYNGTSAALNIMGETVVTARDYKEVVSILEKYFSTDDFENYSVSVVVSPFSGEIYNDYGDLVG